MSLDALFKLDPTSPASNSNFAGANTAENCPPSGINNAIRALGQMAAQQVCYRGPDISASVSTNICTASTGLYMAVLGSGNISSFGVVPGEQATAAVFRILRYDSSASVSHSDSKITLLGGVSRRMQPGDVQGLIHEGTGDGWREVFFGRADGTLPMDSLSVTTITNRSMSTSAISTVTLNAASASVTAIGITVLNTVNSISASVGIFTRIQAGGALIPLGRNTNATYTTITNVLPYDNTIPQQGGTEGDEVLSIAVTPRNSSSIIRARVHIPVGGSTPGTIASAALFVDATAGALYATATTLTNATTMDTLAFEYTEAAASTTARTYRVRLGPNTGNTVYMNGDSSARRYGGVAHARIEVEEILP